MAGFAGGAFDWPTPFSLFTGLALVVTYALPGCCWLIAKTDGDIQRRLYRVLMPLTVLQLVTIAIVAVWTPNLAPMFKTRWFASPMLPWALLAPVVVLMCSWGMYTALQAGRRALPFVLALGFVLAGYIGLLATIYPYAILPGEDLRQ